ncbi:MAG: hypothetical protein KY455_04185 [Euryarchaeota archaeon]|nr:hypothetical protein [Euryarchaeota archaeon]
MSRTNLRLFALFTVAVFATAGAASAQADDTDEAWREEPRELEGRAMADGFSLMSRRDSELGSDRIEVSFSVDDASLRYSFVSLEEGNETVIVTRLAFLALVEFRDRDEDGRYGLGDEAVQRYDLATLDARMAPAEPVLEGGFAAVATYPLENRSRGDEGPLGGDTPELVPGELRFVFRMSPEVRIAPSGRVAPTEVAIDVALDRFPFQEGDTQVALETRFASNRPLVDVTDAASGLSVGEGVFSSRYAWPEMDAPPAAVLAEDGAVVAFSMARETASLGPLRLGAARTVGVPEEVVRFFTEGEPWVYATGALVALVAAGVPAVMRLREVR